MTVIYENNCVENICCHQIIKLRKIKKTLAKKSNDINYIKIC